MMFSFVMFFLSFSPLWISVIFLDLLSLFTPTPSPYTEIISIVVIVLIALFSSIYLSRELHSDSKAQSERYILFSAKDEKALTSEYLLSYILPLIAFDFTVWSEVVLFVFFFLILAWLNIRHRFFSTNVVMEALKYRYYSCEIASLNSNIRIQKTVISKSALSSCIGDELLLKDINNDYVLHISKDD